MKWVFATNQGSLEKSNNEYPRLIRAAVRSAIENTSLQPFMVYDGAETACTREMQSRGVTIVQHRLSFYEFIKKYQSKPRGKLALSADCDQRFSACRHPSYLNAMIFFYIRTAILFSCAIRNLSFVRNIYCAPERMRETECISVPALWLRI